MNLFTDTAVVSTATRFEGWDVHALVEVPSTNQAAGSLRAWSAVRATVQTEGRGRTPNRRWVSDTGGLWLSAVLPCPGLRKKWDILPLAAGWAILAALEKVGVPGLRLRWPNDVLVGRRKLAGLLVERFHSDTAVIGIGLNVSNCPELANPELDGATARLADLVPHAFTVEDAERLVLRAIRHVHGVLLDTGFRIIADELNQAWEKPRRVEITLAGHTQGFEGSFRGIDQQGRLRLSTEREGLQTYDAAHVAQLRELE